MNVAAARCLLHHGLSAEDEKELAKQLGPDVPYHLAVIFVTESNPGGGWWHTSEHGSQKKSQVDEDAFLDQCRYQVRHLSARALTSRIFGAACGMNLQGPRAIHLIQSSLLQTSYLSVLLPTATNLLLSDYSHILPEILMNLYYLGSDLRSACQRVWGRSREARYHTGLLFIDRSHTQERFLITKVMHAPPKHRPYGLFLPDCWTICGCSSKKAKWVYKTEKPHGKEFIYLYLSSCGHVDLRVAVFPSRRRIVQRSGESFVEEDWDREKRMFHFHESTAVRMLTQPGSEAKRLKLQASDQAWTIAGRDAVKEEARKKEEEARKKEGEARKARGKSSHAQADATGATGR
ncbi:hypothetical protein RhiLY_08578 [Ceratobasidium sp. AG-Ba]|nr:hypothetical protein RhiLY_08578 [Ceratobasidium sp. AG-Ba]